MDRYTIWEGHMDALKKKIKRIQKKCEKHGCDFHFEEVGEEFREEKVFNTYDNERRTYISRSTNEPTKDSWEMVICRFVIVEVEGVAIINDWELVAYTEHTDNGNIYDKVNVEVEIPARYRASDCFCEHCKTRRARKNTCIVRNIKTNEFKQVGNTCLKEFTRGMDASIVTAFAEMKKAFEESAEAPIGGCGWGERYIDTKRILQYTAETIRHFGYAKSMSARSTRDRVSDYYTVSEGYVRYYERDWAEKIRKELKEVGFDAKSEEAVKKTEDALAWIAEQEESNDYMHNLKTVCSLEYVGWSRLGILVSLFPTYDRELEREAERRLREEQRRKELAEGKKSVFVGEVGKRITVNVSSCKVVTSWTSCFDGRHETTTYMYRFTDEDGNIFIWKTASDFDEESVKEIAGTVKEHSEFRGIKQTVLTRCKVKLKKETEVAKPDVGDGYKGFMDAIELLDKEYA